MKTKTLFLCGLKSCGKTYYAQKLSEKLSDIVWYDSDAQILKLNPTYYSCRELYKAVGAEEFRRKEQQAIESIIEQVKDLQKPVVVSLGGGVCDANNSLKLVSDNGILVYLRELEPVLYERMTQGGLPPYLIDSTKNPKESFHALYEKRDKSYFCFAKYVINLSEWPEERVLEELKRLIK